MGESLYLARPTRTDEIVPIQVVRGSSAVLDSAEIPVTNEIGHDYPME